MKDVKEIKETISKYGSQTLSQSELLLLLLGRNGCKKLERFNSSDDLFHSGMPVYKRLATMSVGTLMYYGFTEIEALRLNAAFELAKRLVSADSTKLQSISSPEDGVSILMPLLRYETHEKFVIVLLNSKNNVLGIRVISEGSLNSSVVHPREVFHEAIVNHAASIICAHNHPSGDPTPSNEDLSLTNTLAESSKFIGIPVIDHIVIGDSIYFSFKEHGYL